MVVAVVVAVAEVRAAIPLQPLIGFVPFMSPMTRLATVWTEMLDRFMVAIFGVRNAAIAVVPAVGFRGGSAGESEKSAKGESRDSRLMKEQREPQSRQSHKSLQDCARAGFGNGVLRNQTLIWWKGCAEVECQLCHGPSLRPGSQQKNATRLCEEKKACRATCVCTPV